MQIERIVNRSLVRISSFVNLTSSGQPCHHQNVSFSHEHAPPLHPVACRVPARGRTGIEDRAEVLELGRERTGRPAHLLEKDVWVVWTLGTLFGSPVSGDLTFAVESIRR